MIIDKTTLIQKLARATQTNVRVLRIGFLTALWVLLYVAIGRAQCPMICNKEVNISMDITCNIEVTASMVLQGTLPISCNYQVIIMGSNGVPIPGSPFVNQSHVGKTYQVKVLNDHNSCWGTIKVEDKLPPVIACPDPITVNCYDPRTFNKPTATDNCGTVKSIDEISNELEDLGCSAAFSAIRRISYIAYDNSNNKSAVCTRVIYYERVPLDSILWPKNRDNAELSHLDCTNSEGWDKNGNKYPDINETGVPTNTAGVPIHPNAAHCELNTTFVDQVIQNCGASKKIFRTWSIMDWCSGKIRSKIQIIKIVDDEAPNATISVNGLKIPTSPYACATNWTVIAPTNYVDCSDVTYSIAYQVPDQYGNFPIDGSYTEVGVTKLGVTYTITNLPVGKVKLRYKLEDACGNFTYKYAEIEVIDNIAPDVVCDQFTVLTLGTNGIAYLSAETLDNGSRDRCSKVTFEARRMVRACNDSTLLFRKDLTLCCDDVGKDVMVTLRVTDKAGNSNTCMVTVRVQDKINPKIICPAPITLTCGADIENLNVTGRATGTDNCGTPRVFKQDSLALNQCGVGRIFRKWIAEDNDKRRDSCVQIITINPLPSITPNDNIWSSVRDTTLEACMEYNIDPRITGQPKLPNDQCRKIAGSYKDQVFEKVDGVCLKILRVWTVIDWCNYSGNDPENNKFTYTQVIKIVNTKPPTFISACTDTTFCVEGANCGGTITYKEFATDICTPADKLQYTYEIDLNNDGTIDRTGSTNDLSGTYNVGRHKVKITVKDGCGNITVCNKFLVIKDCKAPTPYCIGELTTVIMPSVKFIDIWAKDFDLGSTDNCGGKLKISFSTSVNDTMRRYDCDKLGVQNLQIWVTDTSGNQDFCTVKINIQDNNNSCGNGSSQTVSGIVFSETRALVKDVAINLVDMGSQHSRTIMADANGKFLFTNLSSTEYKIQPSKGTEPMLGVNTLDLVQIQKHILGISKLDSPYKIIAADANRDQRITIADIVELRKLILGITDKFNPENNAWNFVQNEHLFTDATKPWPFNNYSIFNATTINKEFSFMAIKVGDVDGSAFGFTSNNALENRSLEQFNLLIATNMINSRISKVTLKPMQDAMLDGLQLALQLNKNTIITELSINSKKLESEHYRYDESRGILYISYSDGHNLKIFRDQNLLEIELINYNGESPNIASSVSYPSEIYINNRSKKINLEYEYGKSGFSVTQNNPNPFETRTDISFTIPQKGKVTLKVFDTNGKLLYSHINDYQKGLNSIGLIKEDLKYSGLMIYTLEYDDQRITKKMISF